MQGVRHVRGQMDHLADIEREIPPAYGDVYGALEDRDDRVVRVGVLGQPLSFREGEGCHGSGLSSEDDAAHDGVGAILDGGGNVDRFHDLIDHGLLHGLVGVHWWGRARSDASLEDLAHSHAASNYVHRHVRRQDVLRGLLEELDPTVEVSGGD